MGQGHLAEIALDVAVIEDAAPAQDENIEPPTSARASSRVRLRMGTACSTRCRRSVSAGSREKTVIATGREARSWAVMACKIASSPRFSPPYGPEMPTR